MALPAEIRVKEAQINSLAEAGIFLQIVQETGGRTTSLGMLEARLIYEKAYAKLIQSLILDHAYTQLAATSILTMNRFDDELYFYTESQPRSLSLSQILKLTETEPPENDTELLAEVRAAVTLVTSHAEALARLAAPIFLWTLSHTGKPIFKVEPLNTDEYQDGWYSAEEIENWAEGRPTKVSKKSFDPSITLDYVKS